MQTIILTQTPDHDSLLVASLILSDVNQTVKNIRNFITIVLRYVATGALIADSLMGIVILRIPEDC